MNPKIESTGIHEGKTPLDLAKQHRETIDLLRKHGGKTREELKAGESVAEAAKPESSKVKTPGISIHEAATTDCSAPVG